MQSRWPDPEGVLPSNASFLDEVMVDRAPTPLVARSELEDAKAELRWALARTMLPSCEARAGTTRGLHPAASRPVAQGDPHRVSPGSHDRTSGLYAMRIA